MNPDPFTGLMISLASLALPFLVLLWIAYVISVSSNLRKLRKETERQTVLLETIARNTRKPDEAQKTEKISSTNYLHEEAKVPMTTILLVTAILGGVVFVIVMARR